MESFEEVCRVGATSEGRIADAIKVSACESRKEKKILYDSGKTASKLLIDFF